jgi:hypothetical protein
MVNRRDSGGRSIIQARSNEGSLRFVCEDNSP